MKSTLIISTQYFENYNIGPEGFNTWGDKQPHWKPKGEFLFKLEIDPHDLMYTDPNKIIPKLVASHNTEAEKFEYLSHEIQCNAPASIGTVEDYLKIHKELEVAI